MPNKDRVAVLKMVALIVATCWTAEGVTVSYPAVTSNSVDSAGAASSVRRNVKHWAATADSNVLDRFSHRYPDGSYEYRYELADGTARYERGYFVLVDKVKSLVVVGYYSYRMPDGRYLTVFYNADRYGYRQNQSITQQVYPNLPRSIEVPPPETLPLRDSPSGVTQQPTASARRSHLR